MSAKPTLRDALDASLHRLLRGDSISQCIYHYPTYERQLRPLLEAALVLRRTPAPQPRQEAVHEGYARMMGALDAKRRRQAAEARTQAARRGPLVPTRWLVMSGAAVLVVLLIALSWLLSAGQLTSMLFDPVRVTVTNVEGLVLRLPDGSRTWESISPGARMHAGDRLQTMADARAVVTVGDLDSMVVTGGTEIAFVALPTRFRPAVSPGVDQVDGSVRYRVGLSGALSRAPNGFSDRLFGVQAVAAASVAGYAEHGPGPRHFDVWTPSVEVRAEHAQFLVTVAADGSTSVVVEEGGVTVTGGDETLEVGAGRTAIAGPGPAGLRVVEVDEVLEDPDPGAEPGSGDDERTVTPAPLPETPGGRTPTPLDGTSTATPTPAPVDTPEVPTDVPRSPGSGEADDPPSSNDDPTDPEGGGKVPPVPPGLEDKDVPGDAPGLDDREGSPPGQDKRKDR